MQKDEPLKTVGSCRYWKVEKSCTCKKVTYHMSPSAPDDQLLDNYRWEPCGERLEYLVIVCADPQREGQKTVDLVDWKDDYDVPGADLPPPPRGQPAPTAPSSTAPTTSVAAPATAPSTTAPTTSQAPTPAPPPPPPPAQTWLGWLAGLPGKAKFWAGFAWGRLMDVPGF